MSEFLPTRVRLAWLLAPLVLALTACGPGPQRVPGQPAPEGLTDANISSVTQIYNTGEVRIAELAVSKSSNNAIKNFAHKIARDHNQSNTELNAILRAREIEPAPYAATTEIQQAEQNSYRSLENRSGTAFDQAYLDAEINHHRWLINQLDDNLIPGARDGALREYLKKFRATELGHLREAEQLRNAMKN